VSDDDSSRQDSYMITVLIIAMHVSEFVTHHPKSELVVFLDLAINGIFFQVETVLGVVGSPITILIFFYIIAVLIHQQ
jgi:hypothetical protein